MNTAISSAFLVLCFGAGIVAATPRSEIKPLRTGIVHGRVRPPMIELRASDEQLIDWVGAYRHWAESDHSYERKYTRWSHDRDRYHTYICGEYPYEVPQESIRFHAGQVPKFVARRWH